LKPYRRLRKFSDAAKSALLISYMPGGGSVIGHVVTPE